MKKLNLPQRSEEWLQFRKGKVSGSRLKDLIVKRGTGRKLGFYELIAERLSVDQSDVEDPMARGIELENEALDLFEKESGKKVKRDCGVWVSSENPNVIFSPDGEISASEAVEIKCLSSSRHLQAYFEKEVPDDNKDQTIHAFIVNEKLKTLYVVFYDPRIVAKPIHWLEVKREDVEGTIETYQTYITEALKEVDRLVNELTF